MVTEKEFDSIVLYVSKYIEEGGKCTYEEWKELNKKGRKKAEITGKYAEEWKKFWAQWPSMRSFEYKGRKFICNKPFKANEEKLYNKYVAILEDKKENITPEQLYECARKTLLYCMQESYKRGVNQMEYHSGMEPWLNQRQYRNWLHIEIVEEYYKPTVSSSLDI